MAEDRRERKEGKKRMREYRVGKWRTIVHDNGVVEFTNHKRALMLTPHMLEAECISVVNALPEPVLNHFIKLIELQVGKEGGKGGER